MTVSKSMITLLGCFVVGLIVVFGGLLGAYPFWSSAHEARTETDTVAAQNDVQRLQLAQLQEKQSELSKIQRRVGALQHQIPETETWESIVRLAESGTNPAVILRRIAPETATAYVQRTEPHDPSEAAQAPVDEAAAGADLSQIRVTIVAAASSVPAAVEYLSELREGPRLLGVDSAVIDDTGSGDHPFIVTVTGRAFLSAG